MFEETLFEKQVRDFEAIEKDPNKNVDEQEQEDLAGKFGVFGYSIDDENTHCTHYDTAEEAKAAGVELARDLNGRDLAYVEVWQADEKGMFGATGEPIWRREFEDELAKEESKTKSTDKTQKGEKPKELKPKGGGDTGKLQKLEGKEADEAKDKTQKGEKPKELKPKGGKDTGKLQKLEGKETNEDYEPTGQEKKIRAEAAHDAAVDDLVDSFKEWVGEDVTEKSIRHMIWALVSEPGMMDKVANIVELYARVKSEE